MVPLVTVKNTAMSDSGYCVLPPLLPEGAKFDREARELTQWETPIPMRASEGPWARVNMTYAPRVFLQLILPQVSPNKSPGDIVLDCVRADGKGHMWIHNGTGVLKF